MPWISKYAKVFELGFQTALEYRANFALSLLSAAYPHHHSNLPVDGHLYELHPQAVVYGLHLSPDDRLHLPGRAGITYRAHGLRI